MTDNGSEREWPQCPPGSLRQMASSIRARRARRETFRAFGTAAATVSIILIGVVGAQMLKRNAANGDMYFGDISCTDVRKQVGDYMVGHLPPDVSERIKTHLAECPNCQKYMREMQQPMGNTGAEPVPRLVLLEPNNGLVAAQHDPTRFDRSIASYPDR